MAAAIREACCNTSYRKEIRIPQQHKYKITKQRHWTTWYATAMQDPIAAPPKSVDARLGCIYLHEHARGIQLCMYAEHESGVIEERTGKKKCSWQEIRDGIAHPKALLDGYVLMMNDDQEPRWVTYKTAKKHWNDRARAKRHDKRR